MRDYLIFKVSLLFFLFLCSGCNYLFYHPSHKEFHPKPQNLGYKSPQNTYFPSEDETLLHGWFFLAEKKIPKGMIVQFHGNGTNVTNQYQSLIWLVKEGFHFFTFDYRGYGKSAGNASFHGIQKDALAGLKKAHRLYKKHSPQGLFIVVGESLGGAVALKAIEDYGQQEIDLLVLDSSFVSYQEIAFKKMKQSLLTWAISPLAYLLVSDKHSAKDFLPNLTIPILISHAKEDTVVPYACSEYIYNRVKSSKKFMWTMEGKSHTLGLHAHSKRKKFLQFLNTHFSFKK